MVEKFTSPSRRAVPDWLLIYNGRIVFLEMKATGKKPTTSQQRDHERRKKHNAIVTWSDSFEGIDRLLQQLQDNVPMRAYKY